MGGVGSSGGTGTTTTMGKGDSIKGGSGRRKGKGLSSEFRADDPQPMPVYNSPSALEAARRKRQEIMGRSGRTSTNLVGNPGTQTYRNSFLGNV